VGAECREEGVTLRLDFAGLIQEAKLAGGVVVVLRGRKRDAAAGIPPETCVVADFPDAVEVDYTARLLLGGQQRDEPQKSTKGPKFVWLLCLFAAHSSVLLHGFGSQEGF